MCVYCKEAPACDHERDSCAASRGEHCPQCGHGSTAFLAYAPTHRRSLSLPWPGRALQRKRLKKSPQPGQATAAKRRAKKTP